MEEGDGAAANTSELIKTYNCFLVQKVSHNGTLCLYRDHLAFYYADGEEDKEAHTSYSQITDTIVESRLARKMNNLEIHVGEKVIVFSGLNEVALVKDYIALLQNDAQLRAPTMGFSMNEETKATYEELSNPTLICSYTIPVSLKTMSDYISSSETFEKIYGDMGCDTMAIGEWEQFNGYKERGLTYNKTVVLPVLGKNTYPVVETQRLFEMDGKVVLRITDDMSKVPYGDSFIPFTDICLTSNDEAVELTVKSQLVWKSNPFVKSIVQGKTIDETREQFIQFHKQTQMDLLGKEVSKIEETAHEVDDKFEKIRKLYKIIIMILIFLCTVSIIVLNWPRNGLHLDFVRIYMICVGLFFIYVMVYF